MAHEDAERTADVPIGRVRYRARLPSDGVVVEEAGFHTWHLPDGRTLRFQGSYLVRIDWPASASVAGGAPRSLSLYYRQRRLASVTDEAGRVLRLEYTPNRSVLRDFDGPRGQPRAGHLAALVLPDGRRVAYGYDARGNLAEARFDDGTARTYHYEDPIWPHHLTGLTERTGTRLASWTYDERGRAVSSEHAGSVERVGLAFDAPVDRGETVGRTGTTTVTDSLGARSVYTWRRHPRSGASLLLSASGPGCATCPPTGRRYTYTEDARLATATRLDDHGNPLVERRYTWTDDGRLAALHEWTAGGAERLLERREYAPGIARPVLVARPSVNGSGEHTVETTFDADGVPVSITERGHAPTVEPAALGFADTGTQERSRASGTPSAFRAIERTTRFAYADGRLTTIDGPREDVDDVTRLEWHADIPSRLVAIHPPASPPIRLVAHDALGRPSAFRLGSASPWRVERDARGDVVRLTHRELAVTYTRDAEGRVTAIADTDGRTLHLEHDAAGRPERMIDDLGRVTRWLSDTEGRVTERTLYGFDGSLVQSIERLHDAHGRLTTEHESRAGPDGTPTTRRTTFEHDAAGRLVAAEDATSGARRTLAVDPLARLMTLTEPDGATTAIELDANGRERALTDARENRTVTWRDDFGRVVLLDSPDTGTMLTEHDAAGNAVRRTHENGSVTTFAHDAAGRLVARDDVDGHTTWTYGDGGDGAGGANTNGATAAGAHGRLIATSNATTTERFAYDIEGQLVRHARELGGHTFTTRYTRDGRGRLVDKHLPDGQTLRHHYHEAGPDRGRLRAITRGRWFGLASETLVAEIDLDARDGSSGHLTHGGLSTRRRFTPTGELESIEIGQALRLDYRFDAAGRIVGIEENGAARRYDYRGGRLTRALTANATYTYRHDALGNRLARTVEDASGARTERYRYAERGQGNRLLGVVDESTGRETAYDYGADGAPRRIGQLVYTYDAHRRPITLSRSGRLVARYAYNPFGERVSKILYPAGGGEPRTTYFLYDGSTLVAEIDGTDDEGAKVTAQYVYLDGHRAVAKLEGRRAYAIHGDQLGTPLMMTDADGEIVWRAEHTPFGEARIGIEKVRLDLRLPGQYADAESGTHYNYFRDYDPGTGRYVTSDPIGLAGGANTYAYALADPLGRSDPLGLDSLTLSGGLTLSDLTADTDGPTKPSAATRAGEEVRRFGYFALWAGEQYAGYARGFLNAAGEVIVFANDVARYALDYSVAGVAVDLAFEDPPAWLPSYQRYRDTNDAIVEIANQVADNPSLIWQSITDPYVTAWAECRYGEAIGRGAFEVTTMVLPAGLAARLSTLGHAGRVSVLTDVTTVLRRAESTSPEAYAAAVRELAMEARSGGQMDELVEAARESGTLDELVLHGNLSPDELAAISRGSSTQGSLGDANFAQPVIRSDEVFSAEGQAVYSGLAGDEIRTVNDLVDAIGDGRVNLRDIPLDYVDVDGTRLILNTRTSTALRRAGVPREEWYGTNRTGQVAYESAEGNPVTYDQLARDQLRRNRRHSVPGQIGWPDLLGE